MAKKRRKKYQKNNKYNPVIQARKIDKLAEAIDRHQKIMATLSKSHDNHIYYLGNFARHDLKNATQSMDGILSTTSPAEFDQDKIEALKTYLNVITDTMDNFAKLIPYSTNGKFKLDALIIAAELLCRTEMQNKNIEIKFDFPRNSLQEIHLPFHSMFQMLNNLIINSIKSLEEVEHKMIIVQADLTDDHLNIQIRDTGNQIDEANREKVFEYGFSTTGGSGIGLYHAKYLTDEFKGSISLELYPSEKYNKKFTIKIPLQHGEEHNNN